MNYDLYLGDCLDVLRTMADNSVDSVVTDPPYGISFMGKKWDYDVPSTEIWAECLRVLKPGGYLLAFAGTRTQHRMAVRIEDAGFEIRDMIMWVYGSGFPKSLNVSAAIDAQAGATREVVGTKVTGSDQKPNTGTMRLTKNTYTNEDGETVLNITAPATDAAKEWHGWGTSLKPSYETVTVAQKPMPFEGERDIILKNLSRLGVQLWLLWNARIAEESSESSPSEYEEALSIAQWSAEDITSILAALSAQMDMSQFGLVINSCLNIVSSWKRTLAANLTDTNTFTTATASSTTIDWKTLKSCSLAITPSCMLAAFSQTNTPNENAPYAVRYFFASLQFLQSTQMLFAVENATKSEAQSLGGGEGAIKPSTELITVARKPLIGTVAANVLAHGTGAINIDGCRVEGLGGTKWSSPRGGIWKTESDKSANKQQNPQGRFPANLVHDGSDEVVALFPKTTSTPRTPTNGGSGGIGQSTNFQRGSETSPYSDSGSAARFFYCAKASASDRNEGLPPKGNIHNTVKPTDLMRYLVRLVTQRGGLVLDPFMGSGSTGKAAMLEGINFIGIERDPDYIEIARTRIAHAADGVQLPLLGGE